MSNPRTWGMNPERLQWEVFPVDKMVGGVVVAVTVVLARSVACDKVLASVVSHVL